MPRRKDTHFIHERREKKKNYYIMENVRQVLFISVITYERCVLKYTKKK